jgi:predicted XRE-type DNA-binding protein
MTKTTRRVTGDVFRDLGFAPPESENLRVRADLMIRLSRIIEKRALTQIAAARLFGVSQPRVSDLVRGKIERFSVDGLLAMLGRSGARVTIVVQPARRRVA